MIRPVLASFTPKVAPAFKGVTFIRDTETKDLSVAIWNGNERNNDRVIWRDLDRGGFSAEFSLGYSPLAEKLGNIVKEKGFLSKKEENLSEVKNLLKELVDTNIKSSLNRTVRIFLGRDYSAGDVIGKSLSDIDDLIEKGKASYYPEKIDTEEHLSIMM